MRKITSFLVVAGLTISAGFVALVPASAAAGTKRSAFCRQLKRVDASELGNPTSKKGARKALVELRKLERVAKGKTKGALGEIVGAYEELADGARARDVFTDGDVISALGTFAVAAGKCFAGDLPDITLPDIDLPDITLPDLN
jgi:hypothetical protein